MYTFYFLHIYYFTLYYLVHYLLFTLLFIVQLLITIVLLCTIVWQCAILKMFIFNILEMERERNRKTEKWIFYLLDFPKRLQQSGIGQLMPAVQNSIWVYCICYNRKSSICAIICSSECISRKLHKKWSIWSWTGAFIQDASVMNNDIIYHFLITGGSQTVWLELGLTPSTF